MTRKVFNGGMAALTLILIGCNQNASPSASDKTPPGAKTAAAPALAVPLGLAPPAIPADNPMTEAKIELGKMLYFDKRLSKDGSKSCASCHDPAKAWAEHTPNSEGIASQHGDRNSPTVINAAYMPAQFWDGRAASLEEQALGPIENPIEMGHSIQDLVAALTNVPEYQKRFQEVFGTGVTKDGIAMAIAAFERTILSGNSPFDKYQAGDKSALTEQQVRGWELFTGKGECATCHAPPTFSSGRYYNAGVSSGKPNADPGRKKVTQSDADAGKFRVPHLRNVADTGPYFHDGSVERIEEAVRLMATGGLDNPNLSSTFKGLKDAKLTDAEISDLAAFVKALSGEYPIIQAPKLPG